MLEGSYVKSQKAAEIAEEQMQNLENTTYQI